MKSVEEKDLRAGLPVIYRDSYRQWFYTRITSVHTIGRKLNIFIELGATTGSIFVSLNQLFYVTPENKTEALLLGITIRPQSEL